MSFSKIAMEKFITDIKNKNIPNNLAEQFHKIKIHTLAYGKHINQYLTINKLRLILNSEDILKLINHYKTKNKTEQLKIF